MGLGFMVCETHKARLYMVERTIPVSQDWGKPLARAASFEFRAEQAHTCQPGLG